VSSNRLSYDQRSLKFLICFHVKFSSQFEDNDGWPLYQPIIIKLDENVVPFFPALVWIAVFKIITITRYDEKGHTRTRKPLSAIFVLHWFVSHMLPRTSHFWSCQLQRSILHLGHMCLPLYPFPFLASKMVLLFLVRTYHVWLRSAWSIVLVPWHCLLPLILPLLNSWCLVSAYMMWSMCVPSLGSWLCRCDCACPDVLHRSCPLTSLGVRLALVLELYLLCYICTVSL